jgi:hypothetical protein
MSDHLDIVTAQIAGYFVTSVLYGLYLYTFFQCLHALLRSRSGYSDIHWSLVVVTLALFVNGTFNTSLGLLRLIQQFSHHMRPVAWVNTAKVEQLLGLSNRHSMLIPLEIDSSSSPQSTSKQ